jgi:hypothetical protein
MCKNKSRLDSLRAFTCLAVLHLKVDQEADWKMAKKNSKSIAFEFTDRFMFTK